MQRVKNVRTANISFRYVDKCMCGIKLSNFWGKRQKITIFHECTYRRSNGWTITGRTAIRRRLAGWPGRRVNAIELESNGLAGELNRNSVSRCIALGWVRANWIALRWVRLVWLLVQYACLVVATRNVRHVAHVRWMDGYGMDTDAYVNMAVYGVNSPRKLINVATFACV